VAIVFAIERSPTCLAEIVAFAPALGGEARPDDPPLDLDIPMYLRFESANALLVVTARDEGALVGFVVAMIYPSTQHQGVMKGLSDGMWLAPSHRRPRVLARMIAFLEAGLRARGIVECGIGAQSEDHPLARILKSLGYRRRAVYFDRRL
jgi:hypothetical protein